MNGQTIFALGALAVAIFVFIYYKRWNSVKSLWNKITGKNKNKT